MRASGILMPVFSLPGPYGIGTLGREAYRFVDFLAEAGQSYWQILPIGPTGYGDSPYQSFSAFAGNPYFIDFDLLAQQGLLAREELPAPQPAGPIRYDLLYTQRPAVLQQAAGRLLASPSPAYQAFCQEQCAWLEDYALFMAIKEEQGQAGLACWPDPLRCREPAALDGRPPAPGRPLRLLQGRPVLLLQPVDRPESLRQRQGHPPDRGHPHLRQPRLQRSVDAARTVPDRRSGPPDPGGGLPARLLCGGRPALGQPPLRLAPPRGRRLCLVEAADAPRHPIYDVVRIDHFRGFESYFSIPAGSATAQGGQWVKGPGQAFLDAMHQAVGRDAVIAEDLGYLTDEVKALLAASGCPGMKIMQFAFDSREPGNYLPYTYTAHSVVYTGTHDNITTEGWQQSASREDVAYACRYLRCEPAGLTDAMICACLASVSDLAVIPMADWLHLGPEARINTPSTQSGKLALAPGRRRT